MSFSEKPSASSRPYLLRAMYEWLLANDLTPYVVIHTAGIALPPSVPIENEQLVLNISPDACRNLYMGNSSLSFNARFSGVAQQLEVPMASVMAIYARENSQGMVFGQEPSVEVEEANLEQDAAKELSLVETKQQKAGPKKASHLSIVK